MKQFKFNERQRFSIRKFSIGAASVLLGSVFFAVSSVEDVQAAEQSQNVVSVNENKQTSNPLIPSNSSTTGVSTEETNTSVSAANVENKPVAENTRESAAAAVASKLENSEKETLNKTALTKLIEEIDGKFTNGKYASKTEDSVKQLKAALEEARTVLNNAKTQAELSQAHAKLVTATTKLKTKPKDEKQPPAGDTTNGKPTVGLQATNTEKSSDSNSIANSGARDKRHGKALNRSNPFRSDAGTTDTDPAAHQTYTLPGDNASVAELAKSLNGLNSSISNETKLASIDEVGALKNVQAGEVKEIDEFGGWSAVSADGKKGKFAIARKTNEGVFPIETVNTTRTGADDYRKYIIHVEENAFDRSHEYALFLSKVRTNATNNEETFDGNPFKDIGEGREIAKGLKGFNGIEKTYKAYSSSTGTGVNISFKTGFTGDIDGKKAGYKVEVIAKFEDGHTQSIYNQSFRPDQSINNANMVVSKVDANDSVKFEVKSSPEPTTTALNQKLATYKNRQVNRTGSFTSKNIELPKGAIEYTVRISASDNDRLGMGYQTTWAHYALPVSGLGFTITQDTNRVARTLLERVYNKLLDTRDADMRGKTPESQKAYQDQLNAIKALLDGELKSTDEYKRLVQPTLTAHEALKVDKSALTTSKESLDDLVNDDPTPGKTPATVNVYNNALNAAKAEVNKANTIIADESATVDQVAQAVADVKAAKAELRAARAELVVAATDAQKTKLQNDSDALKEADKTGKTPKSIKEYEDKYRELEAAVTAAKAQAKTVLDKTENAGKVEATDAQTEVDKIKAELDKAAALLKDKGNTAELENAKNALKTLTQETNVTTGKTKETSDKYEAAKTAAEAAVTAAEAVIGDINSTTEDVANALAEIKVKKAALEAAKAALVDKITQDQKDDLANAEENLKLAATTGKTKDSIKVYNDEVAKLSDELAAAKQTAKDLLDKGDNAGELEAYRVQAKINKLKSKLAEAAKLLKDIDKSAAKKEVEDAAKKATDAIVANNDLTPDQKEAAKIKVAEEATKAIAAIDKATTEDAVTTATDAGKLGIEKEAAKAEIEAAKSAKERAIDANNKLSDDEKQAAKEEVQKAADAAEKAIDAATDQAAVDGAKTTGKEAVAAVNPVGKEKALAAIEKALAAKEKAIDANDKLSDAEKKSAKEAAKKAADEAKKAINAATDQAAVDGATTTGTTAVTAVNPVGKEKALAAIEKALAAKEKAIEADEKLSDAEKKSAKEAAKKAADEAKKAINAAADQAAVDAKQTEGTKAVSEVNPVGKDKAKAEIEKSLSEKTNAIDANSDLTDDKKADAKAKIAEEAKKAIDAIDKATTTEDVAAAKESGKLAIEKEAEKAEIEAAKAAKEKAIDARIDLTDDEKAKAKAQVAEEAKKAIEAIENAKTHNDASAKTETGKDDIKKINPIGGKEIAKKAIDEALAAKEKAIDARTDLLPEEKEAAKKAAREEALAAKNAIDKAATSEDINKVLEDGKENIAKINPIGAKEEAKKAVEEAFANKEKEIDESTDLTPEEKVKAKALAREEAKAANDAIDKATSIEGIEKALRPFLYQIDQDALVFDLPTFDFEEALKSLVQGTVSIELGSDISDQDVLSKLDLPEGLEVVKIEKPTTTILGATSAKVTIKLSDGSYATVEVPVEVVKKSIDNSKGSEDNRRPEDNKVRVDKATENTNREENRSSVSKEDSKTSKNTLPNTGTTETNTGLAGLGLAVLGSLLAVAKRRKKDEEV